MKLFAEKNWYENKRTGRVFYRIEYFIYHPEYEAKIYLKPADNKSSELLDDLIYSKYIEIKD